MLSKVLAFLLINCGLSAPLWNDPRFINVRDSINRNPAGTWKAAIHPGIQYDNKQALQGMCGTKMDVQLLQAQATQQRPKNPASGGNRRLQAIPSFYDLRQAYPQCSSISLIRTQSNCGSCWAISAASALSDLYCINSVKAGLLKERSFSAQDMLECCSRTTCGSGPNQGCNGGYVQGGYLFGLTNGIVTGENFMNYNTCKPYAFSPFNAAAALAIAPSCSYACTNPTIFRTTYYADKVYTKGYTILSQFFYTVPQTIAAAQQAIMAKGSITAAIDVYSDLMYYSSGVYQRISTSYYIGGHAIKIIGWGTDSSGLDYWIVANSWGVGWGMGGFVNFKRGTNHCRIESLMVQGNL